MARCRVMGRRTLTLLLATLLVVVAASAAAASTAGRAEDKCLCQVSGCLCCVELNLTASIDLGGPACVNVRQREQNVSLNLSYGDNPVHNATIALGKRDVLIPDLSNASEEDKAARKPTCMNLLSDLAQICAEFISMKAPTQDEPGYKGCLVIEPALLGASEATYPVGCFSFERGQVKQHEMTISEVAEEKPEQEEEDDDQGLNAEEIIAAVSASAEQGIALFSQWLGINFSPRFNSTAGDNGPETKPHQQPESHSGHGASRHGRTISLLFDNEDKSDERFKQLLSAQDNIVKESATIGEPSRGLKTAFFYSQPDTEELRTTNSQRLATIAPENLAVVPSESRRGGRAYNIHQHVNEV